MDETLRKVWHLSGQLSAQLSRNQKIWEDVKGKAEVFNSQDYQELVQFTHSLQNLPNLQACMEENQRLKERNRLLNDEARELSLLLREHEQALEKVLEKFRAQTLSVQQSLAQLKLQHLQALTKQQQQTTHLEQELIKNKQKMLHFAGLLRQTLGCALSEPEQNSQLEQLTLENQILREIISTRDQVNALPLDAARSCDTTSLSLPPMSRRRSTLPSDVASPTSITDMLLPDPATEVEILEEIPESIQVLEEQVPWATALPDEQEEEEANAETMALGGGGGEEEEEEEIPL